MSTQASDVRVGDVKLSVPFIEQIPVTTPVSLSGKTISLSGAKVVGDTVYLAKDPSVPEV